MGALHAIGVRARRQVNAANTAMTSRAQREKFSCRSSRLSGAGFLFSTFVPGSFIAPHFRENHERMLYLRAACCRAVFYIACAAQLSEETLAQRCLALLINTSQNHAYMQQVLNESRIVPESVVVERYDENVGQQHIATQLTAKLDHPERKNNTLLCLLENDQPLYVWSGKEIAASP